MLESHGMSFTQERPNIEFSLLYLIAKPSFTGPSMATMFQEQFKNVMEYQRLGTGNIPWIIYRTGIILELT
jgi:hypothetical protein